MPWVYDQSSGDLFRDGQFIGTGYSGKGRTREEGRNNGDLEGVKDTGPIPRGRSRIGAPRTSRNTGPISIPLKPVAVAVGNRSGFLIHGDNAARNASTGCIILARGIRLEIVASGDRELEVVA